MKPKIHPKYGPCKVHCVCGAEWETRSTQEEISLTICSSCHPFYTGKEKFVDTAGRIEKFQRRYAMGEESGTAAAVERAKAAKKDKKGKKGKAVAAAAPAPAKAEAPKADAPKAGMGGDAAK